MLGRVGCGWSLACSHDHVPGPAASAGSGTQELRNPHTCPCHEAVGQPEGRRPLALSARLLHFYGSAVAVLLEPQPRLVRPCSYRVDLSIGLCIKTPRRARGSHCIESENGPRAPKRENRAAAHACCGPRAGPTKAEQSTRIFRSLLLSPRRSQSFLGSLRALWSRIRFQSLPRFVHHRSHPSSLANSLPNLVVAPRGPLHYAFPPLR